MSLPKPDGAMGEEQSGRVREADRGEEGSGERRDGGRVDVPFTRQKEAERGCGGGKEREREEVEKLVLFPLFSFVT